jgi:hypothetical protein
MATMYTLSYACHILLQQCAKEGFSLNYVNKHTVPQQKHNLYSYHNVSSKLAFKFILLFDNGMTQC